MVKVQISRAGTRAELTQQEEAEAQRFAEQKLLGKNVSASGFSLNQELRARFLTSTAAQRRRAIQQTAVDVRRKLPPEFQRKSTLPPEFQEVFDRESAFARKGVGEAPLTQKVKTAVKMGKEDVKELIEKKGVLKTFIDLSKVTTTERLKGFAEPVRKEEAISLFFLPIFFVGGAAKTESNFVQDQITGRFVTKAQANQIARKRLAESLRTGITKVETPQGDVIDLNKITRDLIARNKNNPANLKKLRSFYKSNNRETLFDDILEQETLALARTKIKLKRDVQKVSTIETTGAITGKVTTLRGAGAEARFLKEESAFAGKGQFEKTTSVINRAIQVANKDLGLPLKYGQGSKLMQNTLTKAKQNQATLPLQALRLKQNQIQEQNQLQRQLQNIKQLIKQATRQKLGQAQLSLLRQQQKQIQEQIKRLKSRGRGRLKPRPRIPFAPFLPKLKTRKKTKRIKTAISGKIPKFDVFTRKKGKIIRISKKPLKKSDALDFGSHSAGTTLRASFGIKPSSRKGLGKIPTEITGFLKRNRKQFRLAKSKALKGFLVEKRKFRLDSKSEVKAIKKAKLKSSSSRRMKKKRFSS